MNHENTKPDLKAQTRAIVEQMGRIARLLNVVDEAAGRKDAFGKAAQAARQEEPAQGAPSPKVDDLWK